MCGCHLFPVTTITNRDINRSTRIQCVVVYPVLYQGACHVATNHGVTSLSTEAKSLSSHLYWSPAITERMTLVVSNTNVSKQQWFVKSKPC
ncbi:hypothetical protein VIGAN_04435800 [Vigna angularis var. angularis]|uniref:Uncharacterized protein n=1 Tax=Vigna angularis var. angularis TaxID=157739 RepID=A0A0S3S1F4_PHAAN|nr:hypothetical protein VIGAN_04435800 [Vigna angularis var. angularis]